LILSQLCLRLNLCGHVIHQQSTLEVDSHLLTVLIPAAIEITLGRNLSGGKRWITTIRVNTSAFFICATLSQYTNADAVEAITFGEQLLTSGILEALMGMLRELSPPPKPAASADKELDNVDMLVCIAADTDFVFGEANIVVGSYTGIFFPFLLRTLKKLRGQVARDSTLLIDACAARVIHSGIVEELSCRCLASFASMSCPTDAHLATGMTVCLALFQTREDAAGLVLARITEKIPNGVNVLKKNLTYAIAHGAKTPPDAFGTGVDVQAACMFALLFGREEVGDDETVQVSSDIIRDVIHNLQRGLKGDVLLSFQMGTNALLALSVSDANTKSMVDGGVLDLIGSVLNQGDEIADGLRSTVGARYRFFSTEIYTRGCHWIPRMFASSEHACDQWHSSRVSTPLTD